MLEREIFYENHPDPMWVYDLGSLQFLDVNKAAIAAYGYSREEFLALKATDIRPPEDIPAFPESIVSAGTNRCELLTFRHRRKSGEIFFVQITSQLIDWHGQRAELVSVRDVNRAVTLEMERDALLQREANLRQAAEAAAAQLAEQNATLRTAQRLIGMAVWKYELWSGRLLWSPEVFRMYGVSEAGFGGTFDAYAALVHPDDRGAMVENFAAFVSAGKQVFDFAHRILRPDGRIVHVRGVGEPTDTHLKAGC